MLQRRRQEGEPLLTLRLGRSTGLKTLSPISSSGLMDVPSARRKISVGFCR
jgi:hypothetical protein